MSTSSSTSSKLQAAFARAQLQSGQPWPRRWNWLLDKPHRVGLGGRWFVAVVLLFNGALALLRLTPVIGPQTETLGLLLNGLGAALIPIGFAWIWGALRLHQFHNTTT